MNGLVESLRAVPFLDGEDETALEQLARNAVTHRYPKGNILVCHGEPAASLFLVLSGRVKISLFSEEGREMVLATLRPREIVGLVSAFTEGPFVGTATTLETSLLAKFSRPAFAAWLKTHPQAQGRLLVELANRLSEAYEKIGELALLPLKRRLLTTLLEIAREDGVPMPDGDISFVRPTHRELAELVGSTRVVISRVLNELLEEERGLAAQGNVIRITLRDLVLEDDFGG